MTNPELLPNSESTRRTVSFGGSSASLPFTNSDCSSQRQNQRRLSPGQRNEYTLRNLAANTTYNVGFCAVGVNGDVLGGALTFSTKRNESTTVNYSCTDELRFNGEDGPLNIVVDAEGINTDRSSDTALINVNNAANNTPVDIKITPDMNAEFGRNFIQEGSVPRRINATYSIAARRNSTNIRDLSNDSNTIDPAPSEYRVELAESNWTATFSCSVIGCLNPTVGASNTCRNVRNLDDLRFIAR